MLMLKEECDHESEIKKHAARLYHGITFPKTELVHISTQTITTLPPYFCMTSTEQNILLKIPVILKWDLGVSLLIYSPLSIMSKAILKCK